MFRTTVVKFIIIIAFCGLMPQLHACEEKTTIPIEAFKETRLYKSFMNWVGHNAPKFQAKYMPVVDSVFYPFGGPDIIYPLILFPEATKFVLIGLEIPGEAVSPKNADLTFSNISSLFRGGFFITGNMSKDFAEYSGVRAALGLQILMMDGTILSDELIDPKTARIVFEWQGRVRTVYYLRRDLVTQMDGVEKFLSENGINEACLMKSTSYSPHRKMFNDFIDYILNNFEYIVQDDTGIPYKKLKDFDVQFFGRYVEPYGKEWRGYEQPLLKKRYEEDPNIPHLNFCYGYGCSRAEPNIIIATRKNIS